MNTSGSGHRRRSPALIAALVLLALATILGVAFALYVNDYYRADETALDCISHPSGDIVLETEADGDLAFLPKEKGIVPYGIIFYPGGKVDYRAYAPLMTGLAEQGVACVLVKMPFNLAILDVDAADGITEQFPQVEQWYLCGHSLGGVTAAMYLEDHAEEYSGLILLGAYSSVDLSQTDLSALSIYGENDGVLNREKYQASLSNLPADFTESILPGGCHAYFGSYGMQEGDGIPTCTPQEQQTATVDLITDWLNAA